MKTHTKILFSLVLAMLACALVPSCVGAPKSVQEFIEMDDDEFKAWTARVAAYADASATIALREDAGAREDLERLHAILGGEPLLPHGDSWITPFVPLMLLELQAWIDERGGLQGSRLFDVIEAIKVGVRSALDRPAQ